MMRAPFALALAAAAALAGCTGSTPVEPAAPPPSGDAAAPLSNATLPADAAPASAAGPNVTAFNGTVSGVDVPGVGGIQPGDRFTEFEIPKGTTAIVAEMAWAGADKLTLELRVPFEFCEPVDPAGFFGTCPNPPADGDGASPARIDVSDPEHLAMAGEWGALATTQASPQPVAFTLYISVFTSGPVPAGYTALPPA